MFANTACFASRPALMIVATVALVATLLSTLAPLNPSAATASVAAPRPPKPTSITLTADKAQILAGESATLIATANSTLTNTGATLIVVDQTTGLTLKSCTTGTACATTTTFASGSAHTYIAKISAQVVSTIVTVARAPWTVSLASDKTTFTLGEAVTFAATVNQNVGSTSGNYALYIFDKTSGAQLSSCATGTTCSKTSTALFTAGPAHAIVAVVAKTGATTFATLADIQASSGDVSISRQQWAVTLASNSPSFLQGDTITFTASLNQDLSGTAGAYQLFLFDKTANTRLTTCSTGTVCTFSTSSLFSSGGPHTYVAIVGAAGAPATWSSVVDPQATSNEVQEMRGAWGIVLTSSKRGYEGNYDAPTTADIDIETGEGAQLTAITNQPLGGQYQVYIFDVTTGTKLTSCAFLYSCTSSTCVAGTKCVAEVNGAFWANYPSESGAFYAGGPRKYVAVVGAVGGNPTTPAQVTDVQATSNQVTISRTPWTVTLTTGPHMLCGIVCSIRYPSTTEIEISSQVNQITGDQYCSYIVNVTTNTTLNTICGSSNPRVVPNNSRDIYVAIIADKTLTTWPFRDIQAMSTGFMAINGQLLSTENVGGGLSAAQISQCNEAD